MRSVISLQPSGVSIFGVSLLLLSTIFAVAHGAPHHPHTPGKTDVGSKDTLDAFSAIDDGHNPASTSPSPYLNLNEEGPTEFASHSAGGVSLGRRAKGARPKVKAKPTKPSGGNSNSGLAKSVISKTLSEAIPNTIPLVIPDGSLWSENSPESPSDTSIEDPSV
ncbi:hypothetical protein BDP27DRAFT_775835 [Rhodocollybia butyracea]|uniref:Uncharacterized protein n=1 Tax=Rhodocollybia butyracea TaxID=206335 RepID=A0A9P5PUD8_9AGAR|nr:hypothetical protein BDP27DRAFT_775835 [Rhodocollybia butyracea]